MTELDDICLIMTSVGTEQQAVEISEELIAQRLATCINIVPCLRSIYRWKGKVCEDSEYLLLIKTPQRLFDKVSAAVREFHSYELPEILGFPITNAETNFHEWVLRMVQPGDEVDEDETPNYD